ncbi:MAG TPA: hypothetical protein VGD43_12380, partial [Micromonospora sp.]
MSDLEESEPSVPPTPGGVAVFQAPRPVRGRRPSPGEERPGATPGSNPDIDSPFLDLFPDGTPRPNRTARPAPTRSPAAPPAQRRAGWDEQPEPTARPTRRPDDRVETDPVTRRAAGRPDRERAPDRERVPDRERAARPGPTRSTAGAPAERPSWSTGERQPTVDPARPVVHPAAAAGPTQSDPVPPAGNMPVVRQ